MPTDTDGQIFSPVLKEFLETLITALNLKYKEKIRHRTVIVRSTLVQF